MFAFAMTCYEILTFKPPFHEETKEIDVPRLILEGQRPSRGDIDDVFWGILEDCWNQDPLLRPAFAETAAKLVKLGSAIPASSTNLDDQGTAQFRSNSDITLNNEAVPQPLYVLRSSKSDCATIAEDMQIEMPLMHNDIFSRTLNPSTNELFEESLYAESKAPKKFKWKGKLLYFTLFVVLVAIFVVFYMFNLKA